MNLILAVYCLNAMFLLIHEIESAFEREWEILKLPGGITGFLLLHVPIILLLFYGTIELAWRTTAGYAFGILFGIAGLLPFVVHEVLVRRKGHFNRFLSRLIMYANPLLGIVLLVISIGKLIA
jgi:hypothetical protein